ncbi:uncharacterized protein LOC111693810 [Trichogramma pretiosum]|uniref:uncharacterized protein LOC111693810 n=1 Tax=Trichogramma pretiosum TaxID=7493 RepID=UPI000C7191E9|nr:uncharacterized protein LOC111693810 [Trichogramma pretiosum]
MNEDAATIKDWADRNGLILNTAKTKAVLFASSQQRRFFSDADVPPLIVNNTIIPLEDKVCNLGVTMSKHVLHRLRYRAGMLSCHIRRELAMTLVLPLLDYCCLVYLELPEYLATMLQRVWHVAVRFVFGLRRDERLAPFLERMGCASLEERRRYFVGLQVYRAVSLRRPHYISEMFQRRDTGMAPQTRSSSLPQLTVPDSSSEMRRRSFSIMGARVWNELPLAVRNADSVPQFRRRLRAYLASCH